MRYYNSIKSNVKMSERLWKDQSECSHVILKGLRDER